MSKIVFSFLVVVVLLVGGTFDLNLPRAEGSGTPLMVSAEQVNVGLKEGNVAPNFQLRTLDGMKLSLSDMKGKVVFLNFWATWCPPCKAELPHMQKFYQGQKDNKVEILAVNLTKAERNSNDLEGFIRDNGLTFPILRDEKGEVGQIYQVYTIPTSYLIDKEGIIRKKIIGPVDVEMMENLVRSIE